MRHSSWTLFLVPLTLPLVLLCLPGSMRSGGNDAPAVGQAYEHLQEADPSTPDPGVVSLGSGDEGSGRTSEALFKD